MRLLHKYRIKGQHDKLERQVQKLKESYSLKDAARRLSMSASQFNSMCKKPKSKSKRAFTEADKDRVTSHFEKLTITQQLPYRKYSKYRYLRSSIAEAYKAYADQQRGEENRVLSLSSVYRFFPEANVKCMGKVPFKDCQCDTCLNTSYYTDALLNAGVKGIYRRGSKNVINSYCPLSDNNRDSDDLHIIHFPRNCIYRDCRQCGPFYLREKIMHDNPQIDVTSKVYWHHYETVKREATDKRKGKKFDKFLHEGSLLHLLNLYCDAIGVLSVHLFNYWWQAKEFEECKKALIPGDVLMVLDFAQNFVHKVQNEPQAAHWHRHNSTLHPVVCYYLCSDGTNLIKDEVLMITDDLDHDHYAVRAFQKKVMEHLTEEGVTVKRVIQFSDNCAAQYKSFRTFDSISQKNIAFLCNYSGAKHGKSVADAVIGRVSWIVDAQVRAGNLDIYNSVTLTHFLKDRLTMAKCKDGMCQHYKRHFYFIPKIPRPDEDTVATTMPETKLVHSIRNTGRHGYIETRDSSCFCDVCFVGNEGVCKNAHLVRPFHRRNLYGSKQEKTAVFNNNYWPHDATAVCAVKKKRPVHKLAQKIYTRAEIDDAQKSCQVKKAQEVKSNTDGTSIPSTSQIHSKRKTAPKARKKLEIFLEDSDSDLDWIKEKPRNRPIRKKTERTNLNISGVFSEDRDTDSDSDPGKMRATKKMKQIAKCDSGSDWMEDHTTKRPTRKKTQTLPKARKKLNVSGIFKEKLDSRSSSVCFAEQESKHRTVTRKLHARPGEEAFWECVTVKLSKAKTFGALQRTAGTLLDTLPALPEKYSQSTVQLDRIDELALESFPDDVPLVLLHHTPVQVYPDGNCFPRALSRIVYGEERHCLEMRCRLVIEMAMNCNLYLNHDYLMRNAMHRYKKCNNIAEQYCTYTTHYEPSKHKLHDISVVNQLFQDEVMSLRTSGTYCGVWEFHAASNCIKRKLFGIYPRTPALQAIRNDHHRMFLPQQDPKCTETVAIMWTRTNKNSNSYDHFVPLCSPVSN
jgi:hypothetical protein